MSLEEIKPLNIFSIPDLFRMIMGYLSFTKLFRKRRVCKYWNHKIVSLLNDTTFVKIFCNIPDEINDINEFQLFYKYLNPIKYLKYEKEYPITSEKCSYYPCMKVYELGTKLQDLKMGNLKL